jgi:hypothetical protein
MRAAAAARSSGRETGNSSSDFGFRVAPLLVGSGGMS